MLSSRVLGVWALGLGACATTAPAQSTAAQPPAAAPPADDKLGLIGTDVKRLEEISRLDHQNHVQAQTVKKLEATVSELEAKLNAALAKGGAPTTDAAPTQDTGSATAPQPSAEPTSTSVASVQTPSMGRVRVRLSGSLVFEPASARISRAGRRVLVEVAQVLRTAHARRIEVTGHTDSQPTNKKYEDNWQLSGERAHRVVAFLAQQGVDPHQLVASAYADIEPVDAADSVDARARNRRVEIFVEQAASPPDAQ